MAAVEKRNARIVFLCSGGGGNLRFVHEAAQRGWLGAAEIAAVLTDRPCAANDFARSLGIPQHVLDFTTEGQEALLKALRDHAPDLVVTTVHRILRPDVVAQFRGRLLNLHYSLLPAFGGSIGRRPVQAALEYGACFTGVTAHLVDETVDGGRPVVQGVIPLRAAEDEGALMNIVFRCGCIALLSAMRALLLGGAAGAAQSLQVGGRPCFFSADPVARPDVLSDEALWSRIAAG